MADSSDEMGTTTIIAPGAVARLGEALKTIEDPAEARKVIAAMTLHLLDARKALWKVQKAIEKKAAKAATKRGEPETEGTGEVKPPEKTSSDDASASRSCDLRKS